MVADDGGRVGVDDAAAVIDHDQSAVDADGGEHGGEQGCFVFAVAVAVAEDVGGVVRLIASDAHFDDEVADLFLDELGDGFGLVVEVGLAGDEFFGLGGDLGGGDEAILGEVLVPLADALANCPQWAMEWWGRRSGRSCGLRARTRRAQA